MAPGLRERKKLKTRAAIREAAIRLFLEKGFERTTIEEIAAAVDISPSTFFNYFPSKEDVFLEDDFDPILIAAFNAQPAGVAPIPALRNAMRSVFSQLTPEQEEILRKRTALMVADPDLRAATLARFASLMDEMATLMAQRTHRSPDDFAVRVLAGGLLGVFMAVMMNLATEESHRMMELMDVAMAQLEGGLKLD